MYVAILGRQPEIGIAELERLYGEATWFSSQTAIINTDSVNINHLGGSQKIARIVKHSKGDNWQKISVQLIDIYYKKWQNYQAKITLGISVYGLDSSPKQIQTTGLKLKTKLKLTGTSLRLVPNQTSALSTATSHHNKLGLSDNKVELIIIKGNDGSIILAESTGSQNISAYAARDQKRPKRDAFVGMLPPKLAQIMINLATGPLQPANIQIPPTKYHLPNTTYQIPPTILDPFCGTGVILQEAALMGLTPYGSDRSQKMIDYSAINLEWLGKKYHHIAKSRLETADATEHTWQKPIEAVVSETYLGQPFSAPPSDKKLEEVIHTCNSITSSFLQNIAPQLKSRTPLCLAIPAWRGKNGQLAHLPITKQVNRLGLSQVKLNNIKNSQLVYSRPDQVVARQLLLLQKSA